MYPLLFSIFLLVVISCNHLNSTDDCTLNIFFFVCVCEKYFQKVQWRLHLIVNHSRSAGCYKIFFYFQIFLLVQKREKKRNIRYNDNKGQIKKYYRHILSQTTPTQSSVFSVDNPNSMSYTRIIPPAKTYNNIFGL